MPTADREGLREALADQIARVLDPDAHHLGRPDYYGPEPILAGSSARVRVARKTAVALIAGPLAETLAQADTAAQAVADLATQTARIKFLETEVSEALDRHEAVLSQKHCFEEKLSDALAEVARLSAEVEALRADKTLLREIISAGCAEVDFAEADEREGSATDRTRRVRLAGIRDALRGVGDPKRVAALAAGQDKTEGGKPTDPTPQKERADG